MDFYTYRSSYGFSSSDSSKVFLVLEAISFILLVVMLGVIFNERYYEKDQFQYIYYMSKITTIKSIILDNHYTEILDSFSYSGQPTTISTSYRNLLKLVKNKDRCISNYKPCGILDTYGNVLCIDEFLDCPINRLKVDHINKASIYSAQNYNSVSLSNLGDNNRLYYSNNFDEGNVATVIIKTKDEPKYMTSNNFILDTEAYKEIFGDQDFLNQIADVFGLRDDQDEKDAIEKADDIITIFKKIQDIGDDIDFVDIALTGAKLLYTIINYQLNQQIEKFNKYVKEQLDILDEKNIDLFYEHIGGDFYAKNYIGFRSVEDINKFMRFDYNIYKKRFPTFRASLFAIAGLVIIGIFAVGYLYCLITGKTLNFFLLKAFSVVGQNVIYYAFSLGFFIYALYVYIKVNKNKSLDELKSVKSDEYINSMIEDFVDQCQKSALIISTLVINGISIVINIIAIIVYKKSSD